MIVHKLLKITVVGIGFLFTNPLLYSHPESSTSFEIDINSGNISVEVKVPLEELNVALNSEISSENISSYKSSLKEYILEHIKIINPDGKDLAPYLDEEIRIRENQKNPSFQELHFKLLFYPTGPDSGKRFQIESDFVLREVPEHQILIYLRRDWESGVFSESPIMVGTLRFLNYSLPVEREKSGLWVGFKSTFLLGMKHISEGYDHLLFLIMLLLPAPLELEKKRKNKEHSIFRPGRFEFNLGQRKGIIKMILGEFTKKYEYRSTTQTIYYLLKIITAFTVGHSFTLILGVLKIINPPMAFVEVIIALSVMISALHVVRPFFKNLEFSIAGGFGLIHGLAFSETISEFGLQSLALVLSILGFNLGIEIVQVLLVIIILPLFYLIIRYSNYTIFKNISGILGIIISYYWVLERIS